MTPAERLEREWPCEVLVSPRADNRDMHCREGHRCTNCQTRARVESLLRVILEPLATCSNVVLRPTGQESEAQMNATQDAALALIAYARSLAESES